MIKRTFHIIILIVLSCLQQMCATVQGVPGVLVVVVQHVRVGQDAFLFKCPDACVPDQNRLC